MKSKEWKKYKLEDIADFYDSLRVPLNSRERAKRKGEYPYYGASGIVDYIDSYIFEGEYVLISEDGENLRSRQTPIAFKVDGKFWVNNHAHVIKGKEPFLNDWIVYFFKNLDVNPYITGAVQPKLNRENLQLIEVSLPEFDKARKIAFVLSKLDEKIELNYQINISLESIARSIFRERFVNNQDAKDWETKALGNVLEVLETGSRPKGGVSQTPVGVPSVGAESIVKIGYFDFSKTKYVPLDFFNSMRRGHVKDRDVLLYKDGGRPGEFIPHVSMFGDGFPFEIYSINEHVYRLRVSAPLTQAFLYLWLTSDEIMEEMKNRGTGAAIPGLNSTALSGINITIPPKNMLDNFSNIIEPLFSKIFSNSKEIHTLMSLRDNLLPKLMNGEIEV